ncbi:MAG TPA: tetratricopeptide repeat protein [Burkholderiales bacterium]|nr:tetratricopeptide repeat protein [Burkholderiales bacterium]
MLAEASAKIARMRAGVLACALLAACSAQPPASPPSSGEAAVIEANRRADAYFRSGNLEGAARYYREATRLAQSVEDLEGIAANAISLSIVYQRLGRFDEARASLAPLLEQSRLAFSPDRLAQAELRRSVLDLDERRFASAREWADRAAAHCGQRDCALAGAIHNVKGQLALEAGRLDLSAASAKAALSASRASGDRAETGNALRLLGVTAIRAGDAGAATGYLGEALAIDRELAVPRKIYLDLIGLGRASTLRGDRGGARAFYERARAVSEADRDAQGAAEARALSEALGGDSLPQPESRDGRR